jgi:hypothetical protein
MPDGRSSGCGNVTAVGTTRYSPYYPKFARQLTRLTLFGTTGMTTARNLDLRHSTLISLPTIHRVHPDVVKAAVGEVFERTERGGDSSTTLEETAIVSA